MLEKTHKLLADVHLNRLDPMSGFEQMLEKMRKLPSDVNLRR